jgi:hypothetical protein
MIKDKQALLCRWIFPGTGSSPGADRGSLKPVDGVERDEGS